MAANHSFYIFGSCPDLGATVKIALYKKYTGTA